MAHISEAAPLQISRFYTGWYSYRNPLIVPIRQMGRRIIELYDAISDGLNMECSNRLTLVRRSGYTAINPHAPNGKVYWFYAFKPSDFPGQIYHLVDTSQEVEWMEPGTRPPQALVKKQAPMMTNFSQVAAYCYMANPTFSEKWDSPAGAQGMTRWGIDAPNNPLGPNSHTAQNNMGTQPGIPPLPAWGNAGSNAVRVDAPDPGQTNTSQWLAMWNFGFHFTTTQPGLREISGMQVHIKNLQGPDGSSLNIRMMKSGSLIGVTRNVALPLNQADLYLGGASELWGASWNPGDWNAFNTGVAIQAVNQSNQPVTVSFSDVEIAVFYLTNPVASLTSGPINAQVGYLYVYTYSNSYSGAMSSPSSPSATFPPDAGADPAGSGMIIPTAPNSPQVSGTGGVNLNVQGSADPQVTHIHIFRTTDGGGEPFFELPNSPIPNPGFNVHVTVTDTATDDALQIASIAPDPHFNDPPPDGAVDPVWFAGRFWMHRGATLFFASGPDVVNGNGEEAWNPVYAFGLPAAVIRKFPTPNGLILVTLDDMYIVRGIATANFTVNEFMRDIGMRTWTAGDSDGSNIYIYTSDRQYLLLNANGLTTVAQSIADRIDVVDPSLAYVGQFRHTGLINLLFMGDGEKTLYPLNVELQAWNLPEIPRGGVGAMATVEVIPGVWQIWRARPLAGSPITFRDPTVWTDEGVPYPCWVTFGAIPVADFLTLAQMRDIVLAVRITNTRMTSHILANEIYPIAGKQFEIIVPSSTEPPELSATPSLSYRALRYTWKSAPLPEFCNLFFHRVDFDAEPVLDEIYCWTAGGTQTTGGSSLGQPGQLPQLQGR